MCGVSVVGIYMRDQDEALTLCKGKLGFKVHTGAKAGDYC